MDTVLIVEDEKLIRQGIKSMILRSGVPVQTIMECSNGLMALEILREQPVDVMFTDIRMPKMDGIALVQNMQELEHKPLTVVISGYDEFSYAVEMLRKGVREYLLKPVDREQITSIMQMLEKELAERKEEQETNRQMGYQQLRYLCVSQGLSEAEKELICKSYGDSFFQREYVVCCSNYETEEDELNSACIYLKDVDEQQVFLVEYENKGFLIKNELRGCYVGFSEPVFGIAELGKAFAQAYIARKKAFSECERLVTYETGLEQAKKQTELNEHDRQQLEALVHMLGTNRVEEAVQAVKALVQAVRKGNTGVDLFHKQICHLLQRVAKNYENVLKVKEENVLELQEIFRYQTIEEYEAILVNWMYRFNELISEEFDDYKTKQKVQMALSYIHEHYNKELNMAVVSNHISMNYSLFSQVFKQYTGKNFVNYLKELRMQEAKRLLEETDMRIVEISVAVGYENEKHFMKLFKAVCGVSPTEYRKNIMLK